MAGDDQDAALKPGGSGHGHGRQAADNAEALSFALTDSEMDTLTAAQPAAR